MFIVTSSVVSMRVVYFNVIVVCRGYHHVISVILGIKYIMDFLEKKTICAIDSQLKLPSNIDTSTLRRLRRKLLMRTGHTGFGSMFDIDNAVRRAEALAVKQNMMQGDVGAALKSLQSRHFHLFSPFQDTFYDRLNGCDVYTRPSLSRQTGKLCRPYVYRDCETEIARINMFKELISCVICRLYRVAVHGLQQQHVPAAVPRVVSVPNAACQNDDDGGDIDVVSDTSLPFRRSKVYRVKTWTPIELPLDARCAICRVADIQQHIIRHPIDYVHLQRCHVAQVNTLCSEMFWPDIDVKECLQYPDHCIVAMYRALVIGVAFLTPDGYLLYIAVKRGFDDCHIGTTLLFLAKQGLSSDITLHVGVTNDAVIFYQKFGFKAEEYLRGFYTEYYVDDTVCPHAFKLRLRNK